MAFWLLKSEPASWSWTQTVEAGKAGTPWTGVRNHSAKAHLQAMVVGEHVFFYHSNTQKAVVGIVTVIATYAADPTDPSGRFGMVQVRAVEPLPNPVDLSMVRANPVCAAMVLIHNSRLSVQPVSEAEWAAVCAMGGL